MKSNHERKSQRGCEELGSREACLLRKPCEETRRSSDVGEKWQCIRHVAREVAQLVARLLRTVENQKNF